MYYTIISVADTVLIYMLSTVCTFYIQHQILAKYTEVLYLRVYLEELGGVDVKSGTYFHSFLCLSKQDGQFPLILNKTNFSFFLGQVSVMLRLEYAAIYIFLPIHSPN